MRVKKDFLGKMKMVRVEKIQFCLKNVLLPFAFYQRLQSGQRSRPGFEKLQGCRKEGWRERREEDPYWQWTLQSFDTEGSCFLCSDDLQKTFYPALWPPICPFVRFRLIWIYRLFEAAESVLSASGGRGRCAVLFALCGGFSAYKKKKKKKQLDMNTKGVGGSKFPSSKHTQT